MLTVFCPKFIAKRILNQNYKKRRENPPFLNFIGFKTAMRIKSVCRFVISSRNEA